jgi:hypothetical protein
MIYCGKAEFGQIPRSFALNSGAIRLKRPKNLTQIGFPSLRSVKSDRLLVISFAFIITGYFCTGNLTGLPGKTFFRTFESLTTMVPFTTT